MAEICIICGSVSLESRQGEFRFEVPENIPGGTMVIADASWEECTSCHEVVLPPELLVELDKERYQRLGLLNPEQILQVRQRAGLTQGEMSHVLGLGEKTYTRWETGRSVQNKANDNLIRLFDQNLAQFVKLETQRDTTRREKISKYFETIDKVKGQNEFALAAHDGCLSSEKAERLRKRLLEILVSQKEA